MPLLNIHLARFNDFGVLGRGELRPTEEGAEPVAVFAEHSAGAFCFAAFACCLAILQAGGRWNMF